MEALGWRRRRGSSPAARRGARQRAGLTPASASNTLSCQRETPHFIRNNSADQKSLDEDHGIYRDPKPLGDIWKNRRRRNAAGSHSGGPNESAGVRRMRAVTMRGNLPGASAQLAEGQCHGRDTRNRCGEGLVDRDGWGQLTDEPDGARNVASSPRQIGFRGEPTN